ncbi:hypothetical protein BDN67DRAFT_964065 [Paxillus ammoniavirescens]|nr:hypothetical protein BDN67DRAFT_964065 [Paxillus ammoniavirescens]
MEAIAPLSRTVSQHWHFLIPHKFASFLSLFLVCCAFVWHAHGGCPSSNVAVRQGVWLLCLPGVESLPKKFTNSLIYPSTWLVRVIT